MGIPAYFSNLVKSFPRMIKTKTSLPKPCDHLYMDCNSIFYDVFHEIMKSEDPLPLHDHATTETRLIVAGMNRILEIVNTIQPEKSVFLAMDGVAPLAKMNQQRERRHKAFFMASPNNKSEWGTHQITPGTGFMNQLAIQLRNFFEKTTLPNCSAKIYVSASDEEGEGEHKLFERLRCLQTANEESVWVYGLDADLIMLALFHLSKCPRLVVFREPPAFEFMATNKTKEPFLFLDIAELAKGIEMEMNCSVREPRRIHDYVFLCFFLGNDFLPHFPALNLRSSGIQILLDTYRKLFGSKSMFLLEPDVNWNHVHLLICELAKNESTYIQEEIARRDRWRLPPPKPNTNPVLEQWEHIPQLYRAKEKSILPEERGWESRYWTALFPKNTNMKKVVNEYLLGLEWVTRYYSGKTGAHWRWHYDYAYAPLLTDLAHCPPIPCPRTDLGSNTPVSPTTQLMYVMPLFLLPQEFVSSLLREYAEQHSSLYVTQIHLQDFEWSFKKYFWESHLSLPPLTLYDLGVIN